MSMFRLSILSYAISSLISLFVPTAAAAAELRLAPLAFVRFCQNYPDECVSHGTGDARVALTKQALTAIARVNAEVNRTIQADPTLAAEPIGRWRVHPGNGNCNDYAVTKRHDLISAGIPSSALLLTAVETQRGEGHLVLIVRGMERDLVLDNLNPRVVDWTASGYRRLKIQASHDPMLWES